MDVRVVAWAVYVLGIASVVVFFVDYAVSARLWRRPVVPEVPGVRRARWFILILSGALLLRHVSGLIALLTIGGFPSTVPGALGAAVGALVCQVALLWLLQLEKRDHRRKAARS